jgi:hypothetical protein
MIESLFGDLAPRRLDLDGRGSGANLASEPGASTDLLVDASAAEAMRRHFADSRADLQHASAMITLLDPSRLWAGEVVRTLSDAAGQPVQRLHLRARATLRTLAVVERTLVPRRGADALRVYQAEMRGHPLNQGLAQEQILQALAEASQLTAVIVGAMQPQALLALLRLLLDATRQPDWRCPALVFLLPPAAAGLRQRILEQHWPPQVRATTLCEPMTSAISVWNCVLGAWENAQRERTAPPKARQGEPAPVCGAGPARCADRAGMPDAEPTTMAPPCRPEIARPTLARLLAPLARSEGLLACGIVDLTRGDLLASQSRAPPGSDMAALALGLCAARQAHLAAAGAGDAADEILITGGPRQALLRTLPGCGGLGFVALLERTEVNLALLRFKLLDAERLLA